MASKKSMISANALLLPLLLLLAPGNSHGACKFPAIYNFGDSNSDTGGRSAALGPILPPYGETFFHRPAGRYGDGRLIMDFICEELGLPYLSGYLDSVGANFRHGANFATGGSSILPGGFSPFHLGIQISQFLQFKSRTAALHKDRPDLRETLPRPEDFSKALYTFDIAQNDLYVGFLYNTTEQVEASLSSILNELTFAIQEVYKEGARNFWIHNTGPVGCLPYSVLYHPPKSGEADRIGCVEAQNKVAREFNRHLQQRVKELSMQHPQASFTYVDMYTAKYELISHAKEQGLVDHFDFCCGSFVDGQRIECGTTAVVNGTLLGKACHDPSSYVSWDGLHYTEASNKRIAKRVLNGSLSTPPVSVANACHQNPRH